MKENIEIIISDNAEVLLDALVKNELLKEIQILGTSINFIKAVRSIRDKAYLHKVEKFINHLGEVSEEQKKRLIAESRKDEKRRVKFGESLFTTIEQSDAIVKIEYLACVFEGFLNNEINDEDLRLACHAIRNSFVDDLVDIIESEKNPSAIILKPNIASGLAVSVTEDILLIWKIQSQIMR